MEDKTKPREISPAEWAEIIQNPDVRKEWELKRAVTVEMFKRSVYGVKFQFESVVYTGDLFILQIISLERPILIIRKEGVLKML